MSTNFSVLMHVRVDTPERLRNLSAVISYYRTHFTKNQYQFVWVEDSEYPVGYNEVIQKHMWDDDKYIFHKNSGVWNKCRGYNTAIKNSNSNVLIFNDVDAILPVHQLAETVELLDSDSQYGLLYPYNGEFLCVSMETKNKFIGGNYVEKVLMDVYPDQVRINYQTPHVLVGHTNSVGGCVAGRKDNILKCNGYNPNFRGWGYEDNEMPHRVHRLGYNVSRINGPFKPLWHLPHDGPTSSPKAQNPYYEHNRIECQKVESMTREQLQEYITTWDM